MLLWQAHEEAGVSSEDREWTGSWVLDANNIDLVNAVRKAVMISMYMTGKVGTYAHDDYDDAMAALNELFRRAA